MAASAADTALRPSAAVHHAKQGSVEAAAHCQRESCRLGGGGKLERGRHAGENRNENKRLSIGGNGCSGPPLPMISMAYVRNERFTDFRVAVRVTNRAWPWAHPRVPRFTLVVACRRTPPWPVMALSQAMQAAISAAAMSANSCCSTWRISTCGAHDAGASWDRYVKARR